MFRLSIYFAGLCMFEPRGRNMEVYLPNDPTQNDNDFCCDDFNCRNLPKDLSHRAMIQFDVNDVKDENIDIRTFEDSEGMKKGLWLLDFETIRLYSRKGFQEDMLMAQNIDPTYPSDPADGASMRWLWPIKGEDGQKPKFRYNVNYRSAATTQEGKLKAVMILRNGTLRTACCQNYRRTHFYLWNDQKVVSQPTAMAAVVRFDTMVQGDNIHLRGRSFDGKRNQKLVLRPDPNRPDHCGEKLIEIWVMNRNYCMVTQQCPLPEIPLPSKDRAKRKPFPEYEYYYDLLHNKPTGPDYPIPELVDSREVEGLPCLELACRDGSMKKIFFPDKGITVPGSIVNCAPVGRTG